MRVLGLDYGGMTVGVAVSDALMLTAQGLEVIRRKQQNKLRQTYARIEALCAEYGVESIVLGYPKNMDNSIGTRAKETEEFAEALRRRTGLPVILWDERLSTVAAHRVLDEANVHWKKKNEVVDKLAAVIILQGYLDSLANRSGEAAAELREHDEGHG